MELNEGGCSSLLISWSFELKRYTVLLPISQILFIHVLVNSVDIYMHLL